jgi:hypothetical protein
VQKKIFPLAGAPYPLSRHSPVELEIGLWESSGDEAGLLHHLSLLPKAADRLSHRWDDLFVNVVFT